MQSEIRLNWLRGQPKGHNQIFRVYLKVMKDCHGRDAHGHGRDRDRDHDDGVNDHDHDHDHDLRAYEMILVLLK
mgnify:CR=1 FL=1